MTVLEAFRLLAPGFAAMTDDAVSKYLTLTASFLDQGCLPDDAWINVQALMAAHVISMGERSAASGTAGPITSEREGDLARSYGGVARDSGWLGQTTYGQMIDDLYARFCGPCIMTRMG